SDLLERFDLVAGYSYPFRDLRQLRLYYQQALDTRRYGSKYVPGSHIYRYQDIQVDILVGQLPEEILGTLLSPDYKLLTEYDMEHGLALVETAAAWYRNMLNISATAAALHIHRNTVTYRLDLIRDKLGIAIDDMKVLQGIALSERVAVRIHHS
ncbi:MAG: helix-turn-helix domain-containing protein, partial [Lachnospiraceae bacterium]|nr:helix-turn-helix domain-containing protein [Lachnospiraceae bacterium]